MFLFRLCCLEANKQEKNTSKLEQTFDVTATVTNIGNFSLFLLSTNTSHVTF